MGTLLIRTLIVYFVLIGVMRIMGKRQIGELQLSELITALLLSDIATAPITDPDFPLFFAVIPIVTLISTEILITYLVTKSQIFKRMFDGTPSMVIEKGELKQPELRKLRMSIEEFLAELRQKGIADLSDVDYAIVEQNGKLSVFPKQDKATPTCSDLNLTVPSPGITHPVIVDGNLCKQNIARLHIDDSVIRNELNKRTLSNQDVFLMTVDDSGTFRIIPKTKG